MFNEAYCRDTSIKIRSQLEIKRQRGDFIGSFAVFGYKKDPVDHHKLVIDDFAADVVRDIFNWKLDGISAIDIAARLNVGGIPTPMDYKLSQGMRYTTAFRVKEHSRWSAGMVLRILKNPVYTGVLEQGRVTTPSYRVKRLVHKPRDQWAVVENCHEPIISKCDFETTRRVLAMDTRTAEVGQPVELFSGMVYCGECGGPMVRKTVPSGRKKYIYFVCGAHKDRKECHPHSLRVEALEEIVLAALQVHIREVIDLSELMELTDAAKLQQAKVQKIRARLANQQEEIDRCQKLLRSLYENLADGIIDKNEYQELKSAYQDRLSQAEEQAEFLREEMGRELDNSSNKHWIEQFIKHRNIVSLDRRIVVTLIERVLIFRDRRVEIVFRWHNEFEWQAELVARARKLLSEKEAV
ncbi:recombinase family protein [Acutalibacter muris]|uniref:Recombinase n=1 Tax=Acutalibacter muris TaxID=1796620 RepID=A0A1Z2XSE4_9FIRM|nr:recombinase family protein [Acutalibacter muris]ANU55387.1 recombinase [Hungateiclostridiaceae bacterium KB18]ASB41378.1 recombinase [Acutalibacter muris]QQR30640.1 recombinase family protein [Acutalibacter muris]